jgi:hypothetical protein
MQRESGGRRYGKDGNLLTSSKGALGEMQVMPATARDPGFGIKPAKNVSDPDELSRVGSQYVGALLNKYQDPTLTMIAYNYGPGATDKWLAAGADIKKLPKETQNYIRGVNLAKGGEVPGYYDGGTMGGFGTFSDEDNAMDMLRVENLAEERKRKEYEDKYNFLKNSAPELAAKMKPPVARKSAAEPVKTAATPATAPAEDSPKSSIPQSSKGIQSIENEQKQESNSLMDYVKRREARMEKADKEDKNMALLAAGLNMMGGTSPYAMVNIGQGGAAGVQQLAASKRTRAAQEASLGKLYGSAAQTDALNKIRRDQLTQTGDVARERMDQKLLTDKNSFIKDRLARSGLNEQMIQALKGKQLDKTLSKKDAQRLALYESEMQKIYTEADRMFSNPRDTTGFSARKIG